MWVHTNVHATTWIKKHWAVKDTKLTRLYVETCVHTHIYTYIRHHINQKARGYRGHQSQQRRLSPLRTPFWTWKNNALCCQLVMVQFPKKMRWLTKIDVPAYLKKNVKLLQRNMPAYLKEMSDRTEKGVWAYYKRRALTQRDVLLLKHMGYSKRFVLLTLLKRNVSENDTWDLTETEGFRLLKETCCTKRDVLLLKDMGY